MGMWKKILMTDSKAKERAMKPKRRLKKDITAEIGQLLGREIDGLDKCTIATLDALTEAIEAKLCQPEKS